MDAFGQRNEGKHNLLCGFTGVHLFARVLPRPQMSELEELLKTEDRDPQVWDTLEDVVFTCILKQIIRGRWGKGAAVEADADEGMCLVAYAHITHPTYEPLPTTHNVHACAHMPY